MGINILPPIVANQIAAGEVVNRPASVVKELMENAIDAGASSISVVIQDAGRQLIELIDNGCGMNEEDCTKCFLPHATSKISKAEDLHNLTTMGFRGEALASIAAIAQVELRSKQENEDLGTEVLIEGNDIKSINIANCKKGTDIKVKNLFFNVPARRNFLKSNQIETSHIIATFLNIALSYNDIAFSLYLDGKQTYNLYKATPKKRITDIYGENFNKNLLNIEEDIDIVKVKGFISKVDLTRKSKNEQYFFVNNRFMKNSYFANAIERAYQGLLPEKTYPVFFISLTVDPQSIDVNIHPTKTEIKFLDDKVIYSVLYAAARKALGQNTLSSQLNFSEKSLSFPASPNRNFDYKPKISYNNSFNPFAQGLANENFYTPSLEQNIITQTEISFSRDSIVKEDKIKTTFESFQFLNKYIVACMQDSILLIDQHKASKNIIYNKLLTKQNAEIISQKLLLPYNHRFSPNDTCKILEKIEELRDLGIELYYKDDASFDITATPSDISAENAIELIEEFVHCEHLEIEKEEKLQKLLLSMSEKLALKHGKVLNKEEVIHLIADLFKLPQPELLPNNEKVILKVDADFLENYF
ncbi:MAG: DNA mismatch repair endonuclease MutL [Bacteroidales bacterium]|nr:DNA mismatch repair endonuclease MutL [Bacteroidales bacterium]